MLDEILQIQIYFYNNQLHSSSLYILQSAMPLFVSNAIQVIQHNKLPDGNIKLQAPEISPYYVGQVMRIYKSSQKTGSIDNLDRILGNLQTLRPAPPPYRETKQGNECHHRYQENTMAHGHI